MSILDGADTTSHPTRRRPGRTFAILLVVLLLLAGVAVVADRVVASQATSTVNTLVREKVDGEAVDVNLGGFPFLTQVMGGELDEVTATARSLTYSGYTFTDVDARATDVTFDIGTRTVGTAGTVEATGTMPLSTLEVLVAERLGEGTPLTLSTADGRLVASADVFAGIVVDVALAPRAADGQIAVDVEQVSIGGLSVDVTDLPGDIGAVLQDLRIDLPGMPEGVALTDLEPVDGGVRLALDGTDVDLAALAG